MNRRHFFGVAAAAAVSAVLPAVKMPVRIVTTHGGGKRWPVEPQFAMPAGDRLIGVQMRGIRRWECVVIHGPAIFKWTEPPLANGK